MLIVSIIILWVMMLFYFIPTLIGNKRKAIQRKSIFILNIFLGWTIFAWGALIVWAVLNDTEK